MVEERKGLIGNISRDSRERDKRPKKRTIVAEKGDDKVVSKGDQIQKIAKEERDPVVAGDDGHEEELHNIQPDPDWKEGADRDIKAVAKLELFDGIVPGRAKQASSSVSAGQSFDTGAQ